MRTVVQSSSFVDTMRRDDIAAATLGDVGRWKRRMMDTDDVAIMHIDLHGATVGDVAEKLSSSGHEQLPTLCGHSLSVSSLLTALANVTRETLATPAEPGACESEHGTVSETRTAETVGLIREPMEDFHTRQKREHTREDEVQHANVLETLYALPAVTTLPTSEKIECNANMLLKDAVDLMDERDRHAIFTTLDDIVCVVTAEDILKFLGVADTLREVARSVEFDRLPVFETAKDTFLVVRQEHNDDLTAADIFTWIIERNVNAVVFIESAHRVPGERRPLHDRRGHLLAEISRRDILDLDADNFAAIFRQDPVDFVCSKKRRVPGACRSAFVETVADRRDALLRAADRDDIETCLPRRFYVLQDDCIAAFTPLSVLRSARIARRSLVDAIA